ncbi:MAG: carbohydrate binding domain-containing protein [Paludibacteraceae bacterium]|nr:carbohydrate binding domain-containing protein [Paludibacteraceae bacterium]
MKKITFLVAALCATMFASATELVVNGGMETGTAGSLPDSWENGGKSGFVIDATTAKEGTYSAKCTSTNARLEQTIDVTVGKSYTFSFWYDDYAAAGTNGLKNYSLIDATSGTSYVEGGTPAKLDAATEWTQYSKTFTATAAQMKISIRCYEVAYIDEVSLVCNDCGTVGVENVQAAAPLFSNNGTIYGAENSRIYTITGQDVTEQNGKLKGVYVVKANDGNVQKVVVK